MCLRYHYFLYFWVFYIVFFFETCFYLFCLLQCENSWVQIQLKNHPDELWEDGMNDYITHASNILVIFSNHIL